MRYVIQETEYSGKWYVYDTLKDQLVWRHKTREAAAEMAADLEDINTRATRPTVPADVVQRVRTFAAVCDLRGVENIDRADAREKQGEDALAKEYYEKAGELRQRSRDLFTLLKAAGVLVEE